MFTLGDITSEEDRESTTSNYQLTQERSKVGCSNDPKKRTGRETEPSKSNVNHTSAKDAASSRARKANTCDSTLIDYDGPEKDVEREEKDPKLTQAKSKMRNSSTLRKRMGGEKVEASSQINSRGASSCTIRKGTSRDNPVVSSDDILLMFDDDTLENGQSSAVIARRRQMLGSRNRLKNHATSNKGASSVSFVTERDTDTSQLNYSESSGDGDTGIDSDSETTESKGKNQKIMPKLKGKGKALIPKAGILARNVTSKISGQQKQQRRAVTSGNNLKDPGIDCDQLIVSTDSEIKSKGRKNKDHKSGIKTSILTKARGLSSHKSQKGKANTSHLSHDERDKISAQNCQEVVSGQSTKLKVTVHDVAHLVSDQQDLNVAQRQDDKLTQAFSKVGLRSKNAAPRKRGRDRESSKAGIKSRGLTNNTVREKNHLRDDAEKLEGENLENIVRSKRVKSRANDKHDPSIPYQQDQHVPPQKGKLTFEEREHDQMSKRELQKPLFEPRITRAMRKLAQDEVNKTASTKVKGETSSLVTGASNTSQNSQLQHSPSDHDSDGIGTLHFPRTVSNYADITDDLLLDSSLFSFDDLSDGLDGKKSTGKGQSMDGEPIIIESEYIIIIIQYRIEGNLREVQFSRMSDLYHFDLIFVDARIELILRV